ncbi:MAG: HU family DNA-binding protein, partial [Massilimicrobiota sp.]|nr:HU family DNA-binding protein [Massilimicrobiota sp.]
KGFGTFEVRTREARMGRNPRTGETMEIAASKVPAFKASSALKNVVNGK